MSKINGLSISNFKCFGSHIISFNDTTIMIGENNAGKSTVVDALRIVGLACTRFKGVISYKTKPEWIRDIPLAAKGISISSKAIDVDLEQIFNNYNDPPAIISALFENGKKVEVYINDDSEMFAVFYHNGSPVTSNQRVNSIGIPSVHVLPQIAPLSKNEKAVSQYTIEYNKLSHRTSGNFRNSVYLQKNSDAYKRFEELIEKTWCGIKIHTLEKDEEFTCMFLRERDFVIEIYHMGHGVQMWLQAMWFIASIDSDSIIVLDEPDVYMHADLQRKLIRLLRGRFKQTIIATHSVEIMSEVQPGQILIINRKESESILADGYPVLQAALSHMGSIHNINLTRLLNNRTYLYVEGDDKELLKVFSDKIFPNANEPLDHITSVTTGGWGSWDSQKMNAKRLIAEMKGLRTIFIYDRDYHSQAEIQERKDDAVRNNISIHIWNQKEIENYLIVPSAITRFIESRAIIRCSASLCSEIEELIDLICDELKEDTLLNIVDDVKKAKENKGHEYKTIYKKVKSEFDKNWQNRKYRISTVSGKDLFSRLSDRCKESFGVSFGDKQIATIMTVDEISPEIKSVLTDINHSHATDNKYE